MTEQTHALLLVLVIALVTGLLRFLPFLLFPGKRKTPPLVSYLGEVLPFAIIGMLVVYCLKGVSLLRAPFGLPELGSVLLVVVSYVWKRNTLLSILLGTVCYMLLVQCVF